MVHARPSRFDGRVSGLVGLGAAGILVTWLLARPAPVSSPGPAREPPAAGAVPVQPLGGSDGGVAEASARTPARVAPSTPVSDVGAEPLAISADADAELTALGEREHYEGFLATEAEGPGTLAARAEGLLLGPGPDPQKVALLRAVRDLELDGATDLWLLAVSRLPDVSDAHGESVPSTALLLLDRGAARDPRARDVLREAAFGIPGLAPGLRGRAASSFLRYADPEELLAAREVLLREREPLVLASALDALARNPHTDAVSTVLADHPAPGLPLDPQVPTRRGIQR